MRYLCLWLGCGLLLSCSSSKSLITDSVAAARVEADFSARRVFLSDLHPLFADTLSAPKTLFSGLQKLYPELGRVKAVEAEALTFLYAYMPLNDILMQTPAYYLGQVRASLAARRHFSWGKAVPEDIFRHFVLPSRVNNEDLDSCRSVFLEELRPRLKGLSMREAALEVNHWCHEKVVYEPTDGRTSGPLAVVARAYGRCGEESVFTTAALRAVGIPARQVYTPRWAHTDDNHAWVEVWVDGTWYYMGACEPEPVLNRGWFNEAAQRAMLVHTWVFGAYEGPEEVLSRDACYTEINVLPTYATVKEAVVKVSDAWGQAVQGAEVSFGLYNYADFYPLARRLSDAQGLAKLTTGLGTLVVQAVSGEQWAIAEFPVGNRDTLRLTLSPLVPEAWVAYRLTPPPPGVVESLSPQLVAQNVKRLRREDSLRLAYIARFPFTEAASAQKLTSELGIDDARLPVLLQKSLSNGATLERFLQETPAAQRTLAIDLLSVLPIKDLREVSAPVLQDHLQGIVCLGEKYLPQSDIHREYLLSPRIDNEIIVAYRVPLQALADPLPATEAEALDLVRCFLSQIRDDAGQNPRQLSQTPLASWQGRRADPRSRNIFGIALARSLGLPARLDPISGQAEVYVQEAWQALSPSQEAEAPVRARLQWSYSPQDGLLDPKYEIHYSLAAWDGAQFRVLGLGEGQSDLHSGSGSGAQNQALVPPGYYRLLTGRRLSDGTVLARTQYFSVASVAQRRLELLFVAVGKEPVAIGSMNPEERYMPEGETVLKSILETTGRGFFAVLYVEMDAEPSRHLIGDLMRYSPDLNATGLPLICLTRDAATLQRLRETYISRLNRGHDAVLPAMHYGYDPEGRLLQALAIQLEKPQLPAQLPLVLLADTFGRVFYVSSGYKVGSGAALLEMARKLTDNKD
jgi:Transglutaminase-like enzymes, putative cysteine proteases